MAKILTLLVLLMTAVTGAWAEEVTIGTGSSGTTYYVPFNSLYGYSFTEQVFLASEIGAAGNITSISFNLGQSYSSEQTNQIALYMKNVSRSSFSSTSDYEAVTAGDIVYSGLWTIPANYTGWVTITLDTPFAYDGTSNLLVAMHESTSGYSTRYFTYDAVTNGTVQWYGDTYNPDPYNLGSYSGSSYTRNYRSNIQLVIEPAPAGPEVTTNAEEEGAPFTEASFDMPTYDLTVDYELVRDMEIDVDADIAERIRIQMNGGKYELVDATLMVPVIVDVLDGATDTLTVTTDYTVTLQKKDGENWVAGDANNLELATYRFKVTGAGLYEGEIYTNEFQLFQGYEVEVGAESFATFYMDEKLTVEESSTTGELYTISSVSADEAVLSAQIGVAPANTPLLVYNSGSEKKTILLIPTEDQADEVQFATEFQGTAIEHEFTATDMQANDYYALSGGQYFVPVLSAGTIAAHKCWLQFPKQQTSGSRSLTIVFEGNGTTGIADNKRESTTNNRYYDLNGRQLNAAPTQKGVYIQNGKKVVVR